MSSGLVTSVKKKNDMFKNFRLGLISEEQFKSYRNRLVNLLRTAKNHYYTKLFTSYRSNTKKMWHTINTLTKNNCNRPKINKIIINNNSITSPLEISESFNNFFVNVAPELERKLLTMNNDPLEFMTARNQNEMRIPRASINDVVSAIKSI